jgi:hypothetical protein
VNALDIITDACERLNLLSPGETLADDLKAFMLRRLNVLCDELSAQTPFLYREVITSSAQTGHITLGAGAWAAVGPEVVSMTRDGYSMTEYTMSQYSAIVVKTTAGAPLVWSYDGLDTIYLYPVATGQTIAILNRVGASEFADLTTDYSTIPGYAAYLGAALAVRAAPTMKGSVPPDVVRAEMRLRNAVAVYRPSIADADSFTSGGEPYNILTG